MTYIATLNLDYTGPSSNEYTRLLNALCQCGWEYAETSALVYDSPDLAGLRLSLEILARAIETPQAMLSALSLQVQFVGAGLVPPGSQNHTRAFRNLLGEPLPSEIF